MVILSVVFENFTYILCPSCLGFSCFKMMLPFNFFDLRHPADEHFFFLEIPSMYLFIVCSVLLQYSSMFLHFQGSTSLWLHHICTDFLMRCFVLFSIIFNLPPFSIGSKISSAIHLCLVFLLTLGICSSAVSEIATLKFTHYWSTSSAFPETSNLF